MDPLKEARAEIEQIDAGLKSRTQALAERGYDAEQVDAGDRRSASGQIAADRAREQRLGLVFGNASSAPVLSDSGDTAEEAAMPATPA